MREKAVKFFLVEFLFTTAVIGKKETPGTAIINTLGTLYIFLHLYCNFKNLINN